MAQRSQAEEKQNQAGSDAGGVLKALPGLKPIKANPIQDRKKECKSSGDAPHQPGPPKRLSQQYSSDEGSGEPEQGQGSPVPAPEREARDRGDNPITPAMHAAGGERKTRTE
jgi:hypothetical protein